MISLRELRKSFGEKPAVRELTLDIGEGEFMVFLGPSGCGKTTALRMIAGLEEPDGGGVFINNREVTALPPQSRDVAMVFQSYALYPHKTAGENIAFPLRLRKVPVGEREQAVRKAAEMVRIADLLDRRPGQMSGGQRQRVALARAIVRRPAAFLMDEPLSNLDAKLRGHMRAELKRIQRSVGVATAYVTHDQTEATTLGDRVAVMEGGRAVQIATPREIYDDPRTLFVAGFVGAPPMNQVSGVVSGGCFRASGLEIPAAVPDCADAVLGVRGEDVFQAKVDGGSGGGSVGGNVDGSVDDNGKRNGGCDLQARVYAAEPMGDHTLVTCRADAGEIIFKADRDFTAQADDPIQLGLNRARLFFFNRATGERLRS